MKVYRNITVSIPTDYSNIIINHSGDKRVTLVTRKNYNRKKKQTNKKKSHYRVLSARFHHPNVP